MSERYGIHTDFAMVRSDGNQLQHLMTGVNGHRLRATVAEMIGLDGIVDALKQSRNGHVRGRIVVIF
jgi:D-arabinose 1-dehydrogenase-like Zn-dependent alcohol dehydrogenase